MPDRMIPDNDADPLATRLARLSPEARALVDLRLKTRSDRPVSASGAAEHPLSPPQEALWFALRLDPNSTAYNEPIALALDGELDVGAAARALDAIISRHEILRTRFRSRGGEVVQEVIPYAGAGLAVAEAGDAGLPGRMITLAREPFDLASGPPFRAELVRLGPRRHALLTVVHHLACDGGSIGIFLNEFARLYEADVAGRPADLSLLPCQYGDFARRAREQGEPDAIARRLAYWRDRLAGAPAPTKPGGPGPGDGGSEPLAIPPALAERIRARARELRATPYVLMLAALDVILYAFDGRGDVAVGGDVDLRTRIELEPLIGLLVTQVVLRTAVAGRLAWREIVGRAAETVSGALAHADADHANLRRAFGAAADRPLFGVKFVLHAPQPASTRIAGVEMHPLEARNVGVKFDMLWDLWPIGPDYRGSVQYAAHAWEASRVRRLIGGFLLALADLVEDPDRRVDAACRTIASVLREPSASRAAGAIPVPARRPARAADAGRHRAGELEPEAPGLRVLAAEGIADPLTDWAIAHRAEWEPALRGRGAVLFRGFEGSGVDDLARLARALGAEPMTYSERSTPRRELAPLVYSSTEYPPDRAIFPHNENSYASAWPRLVVFSCVTPPSAGGRTPIVDVRKVLARLPGPALELFRRRGLKYVRNFGAGLGLGWQEVFRSDDRAEVGRRLVALGYEVLWRGAGGLRVGRTAPAVATHPGSGEDVWFNHMAFFHRVSFDPALRADLTACLDEDDWPHAVRFADGAPIPDEVAALIRDAYLAGVIAFPWRQGDVLALDNMLMAHGREAFEGPRQILAVLAGPHPQTPAAEA